ncbi:heme exporter protein CcmB [Psychromonas sp. 14N.309.X.WAT.B.A12]|uniref:heme exporter protein CcmB n=1 Tax=unclassified Psychromonas TaxID=2614957 RepID=UPI0025B1944F|nr:heme exporter protein CcmB [Psychromonas sp. 14N.309.X.WAT.B.A12]MDN2662863.1 heme exporter protein CcmB [Psychromonas sp. 14N.309.X.WAT.B.A12]
MFDAFVQVVRQDLLAAFRHQSAILNPIWFFVIVVTLFPLGLGSDPTLLSRIAPGIIWVAALLAALLSFERLFKDDFIDGSLEQMMLSPYPLAWLVSAKIFGHWVLTGLPILLVSPLLAVFLSLKMDAFCALFLTLLIGTPILSLLGAIGVALTVGLRKGGILLSLIMLPFSIPILIFSTMAIEAASFGQSYLGFIALLLAMLVGAITLAPFAIAAALRVSVS